MVVVVLVLMVPGRGLAGCLPLGRGTSCGCLSPKQLNPASGNPEMGSPAIPKLGKIGTQQDSRCYLALFTCRMVSGWDVGLVLVTCWYLVVRGCLHCGRTLVMYGLICQFLLAIALNLLIFVSWSWDILLTLCLLETNLLINCCFEKQFCFLSCTQPWVGSAFELLL